MGHYVSDKKCADSIFKMHRKFRPNSPGSLQRSPEHKLELRVIGGDKKRGNGKAKDMRGRGAGGRQGKEGRDGRGGAREAMERG